MCVTNFHLWIVFDNVHATGVSSPARITFEGFADADKDFKLCLEFTDDENIHQVAEDSDNSNTVIEEAAPTQPSSSELTRALTLIGVQEHHVS